MENEPKNPPAKQEMINGIAHFQDDTHFTKNQQHPITPIIPKYNIKSNGSISMSEGKRTTPPIIKSIKSF